MYKTDMFRAAKGFNTDYFKIGQLIKVTIRDFQGASSKVDYGFIKYVSFNKIVFVNIKTDGELKEKIITPSDLCQNEPEINIEIVAEGET